MSRQHHYQTTIEWTGNLGSGTSDYRAYSRNHVLTSEGKFEIPLSSDPAFRGDSTRYNPEELLLSALSSCHMLWYLHLCAEAGIVVTEYRDRAFGIMEETSAGSGKFVEVTLNPTVIITDPDQQVKAEILHKRANEFCFIAQSVNFPVHHKPVITTENQ